MEAEEKFKELVKELEKIFAQLSDLLKTCNFNIYYDKEDTSSESRFHVISYPDTLIMKDGSRIVVKQLDIWIGRDRTYIFDLQEECE